MKLQKKNSLAQKRRYRIRKKVKGTAERPRLAVHFSNKHIYAQCIDDVAGHTMAYASSVGGKDADVKANNDGALALGNVCLLYTSPSPRDLRKSRMPSSA